MLHLGPVVSTLALVHDDFGCYTGDISFSRCLQRLHKQAVGIFGATQSTASDYGVG